MELKELEYIVTIAEEGGISKAAKKLYLAQSSLSQFLSRYESELDVKLFQRTGSGVRPTAAGEVFIRNARQMLQQFERVKTELKEAELPKGGRISFGISSFRGAALIPPVLKRFQTAYPTVDVVISEHDSSVLRRKIAAGELDMALVATTPGKKVPEHVPIMKDEVCLVINRSHPAMEYVHYRYANRPWVALEDLADFEFLLSNRSRVLGAVAYQQFEVRNMTPICRNSDLTADFAAQMARYGLGIAFTYGSCAKNNSDAEYVSIGEDRVFVDLVLIFPPDGYRSRSNRALEEMIRDFYRN